jgi:hypothetical protein
MRNFIAVLTVTALCALPVMAETDYLALPKINDIVKGVNNANQIQTLRVSGAATVGGAATITGAATVTGTLTGSGLVKEYGYAVDVGPSATYVYMTQVGTNNQAGGSVQTNTFPITFIEVPTVIYKHTAADQVSTNVYTVASNAFTIASGVQPGVWIARGRVK